MKLRSLILLLLVLCLCAGTAYAVTGEMFVRAGGSFAFAVGRNGMIYGWGDNTSGQLGNGTNKRVQQPLPAAVGLDGNHLVDIACGNVNAIFLMDDGSVYTCGPNNDGRQGSEDAPAYVFTPIKVEGLPEIVKIAAGFGQLMALDKDGYVWLWGRNNCGQQGVGHRNAVYRPHRLDIEHITDIQAGGKYCMVLCENGDIWGWGENASGQLLDASDRWQNVKAPVKLSVSGQFDKIACGGSTSYGLDHDGVLWAWGKNDMLQMGARIKGKRSAVPVKVGLPEGTEVEQIIAYNAHVALLTRDHVLYQWGRTSNGQLGIGKRNNSYPTASAREGAIHQVAVGSSCTYVLYEDGSVWSAGYSEFGQTGAYRKKMYYVTKWVNTGLNLLDGSWEDPGNG